MLADLRTVWSDNYFELLPDESRTVSARFPAWMKLRSGVHLDIAGWNIEPETVQLSRGEAHSPKRISPDAGTIH